MAKRFTDTTLWNEDWFIAMPKDYHLFWCYIKDSCDHAGIWRPNVAMFNKLFDCQVSLKKALENLNAEKKRIEVLKNGRWFLVAFIPFQYGARLNPESRMHRSIIALLKDNEVDLRVIRPQIEVKDRVKDKDKDKDKDICTTTTNGTTERSREPEPPKLDKPYELKTPGQFVIGAFKELNGIPFADRKWDKANWRIHARAAQKLLDAFGGDHELAVPWLERYAKTRNGKGWKLAFAATDAWDDQEVADERNIGSQTHEPNDVSHEQVDAG
jgi:hypothetical protein